MLMFVDIRAVGVVPRRGHGRQDEAVAQLQVLNLLNGDRALGVQAATLLAHLTPHAKGDALKLGPEGAAMAQEWADV